jgi:hypothetical protein
MPRGADWASSATTCSRCFSDACVLAHPGHPAETLPYCERPQTTPPCLRCRDTVSAPAHLRRWVSRCSQERLRGLRSGGMPESVRPRGAVGPARLPLYLPLFAELNIARGWTRSALTANWDIVYTPKRTVRRVIVARDSSWAFRAPVRTTQFAERRGVGPDFPDPERRCAVGVAAPSSSPGGTWSTGLGVHLLKVMAGDIRSTRRGTKCDKKRGPRFV